MKRSLLFSFQRFWLHWSCYWVDKNAVSWVSQERVDSSVQWKGMAGILCLNTSILPHSKRRCCSSQWELGNLLFKAKITLSGPLSLSPSLPLGKIQMAKVMLWLYWEKLSVWLLVFPSCGRLPPAKSSFLPWWLITEIISLSQRWIWELARAGIIWLSEIDHDKTYPAWNISINAVVSRPVIY